MVGGTLQLLTANAHELDLYQGLSSGDPATIQAAIWTAEKIMPLISNDYTKGIDPRTLLNNLIEGQDPPAGKNNQQGSKEVGTTSIKRQIINTTTSSCGTSQNVTCRC